MLSLSRLHAYVKLLFDRTFFRTNGDEYEPDKFWSTRLNKYGYNSLRGVGNIRKTESENTEAYSVSGNIFLKFCEDHMVIFDNTTILDIGCGTGYFTRLMRENGANTYTGMDITDVFFDQLKRECPDFQFIKLDVSSQKINKEYDLITMINVVQHITDDKGFSFAMQNVRSNLRETGVFIVTSWLDDKARRLPHEKSRSLEAFEKEFPGWQFSKPVKFRDKFLLSIRSPGSV